MFKKKSLFISITFVTLSQIACSATQDVKVTTLTQASHCPIAEAGLSLYRTPKALAQALQRAQPQQDSAHDLSKNSEPSIHLEPGLWAAAINIGQRPSAGYGIELASDIGNIKDGTLTIELKQTEPAAGSMQASVITTPCVVVAFPEKAIEKVIAKTATKSWQHSTEGMPAGE